MVKMGKPSGATGLDKKIDTLVTVVKDGFNKVNAKFLETDKKIDAKIDALAAAVKGGFDEVDNKFVDLRRGMDKRFDEVDKRLDRIEFAVNGHDQRLDILEDR